MLAVGPIYLAISATAPFNDCMILSLTTDSRKWSFMHCTSWYHCLKDTSILPGIDSPLNVFIQGVPSHNPMASVFIRCPNVFIGLNKDRGQGGYPLASNSPSGWVGAGGWSGCAVGSHPPPLGRMTSQSSTSGSLFPTGFPQGIYCGSLGVHSAPWEWPPNRDPPWGVATHHLQGPQGSFAIDVGSYHPDEGH